MAGGGGMARYPGSVPYQVSTPVFEGPFDLLLDLISKEKVDLWEVSLSAIVDAYVASLEELRAGLDLDVATEFLLIAAVLLELKTRRLLPDRADADPDEELALWEERDLLLARLLEAKTFKDAAAAMLRAMQRAERSWPRTAGLEERFVGLAPDLLAGITAERLQRTMTALTAPRPVPRVATDHLAPIRLSVADVVEDLARSLPGRGRVMFGDLTGSLGERLDVIVHFLAVLEMYKQGLVDLDQATNFAALGVSWVGGDDFAGSEIPVEEYQG